MNGLAATGNLEIKKFQVKHLKHDQVHLAWENLKLEEMSVSGLNAIKSKSLQLSNLHLLQIENTSASPYFAKLNRLELLSPAINLDKHAISLTEIIVSGLKANIENTSTGFSGLPTLTEKENTASRKKEKEPAFALDIKKVALVESDVQFTDKTVEPTFTESFKIINFETKDIRSAEPQVQSPVSANLEIGQYGKVNINGFIQPFTTDLTLNVSNSAKHIDLSNFNVYAKKLIGHSIRSGQMNLDQKIELKNGQLNSETKLVLTKFKVQSLDDKEAKKYKSDLGVPLSTALSLLRDRNGNIELKLPVTGDINDPSFSLSDVFSTVTGKVIKEAIIYYYTPFGLVTMLGGIIDLATGLNFEPVLFNPAQTDFTSKSLENMKKMARLLAERPQIELTLCGYPVQEDITALYSLEPIASSSDKKDPPKLKLTEDQKNQLLQLFNTRMEKIKKHMVNELEVSPGQVLLCSEPDDKEWVNGIEKKPFIDITI